MHRSMIRAGIMLLMLCPTWTSTSVQAIEIPLPRLELVPWNTIQPDRPAPRRVPRTERDWEAIRDQERERRQPFLYDVMPAEEDREDRPRPLPEVIEIRGA